MRSILIFIFKLFWWFFESSRISFFLWKVLAKYSSPIVICYHRISEEKLIKQLDILKCHFSVNDVNSLLDNVFVKKKTTVSNQISITMDDCYKNDFLIAVKVFNNRNTPCTFFIPTEYSEYNNVLWAKKIIFLFKFIKNIYVDKDGNEIHFKDKNDKKTFFEKLMNFYLWNDMQTNEVEDEVNLICIKNNFKILDDNIIIGLDLIKKYSKNKLFNFQSHSKSHPKLVLCNNDQLIDEFKSSKEFLQNHVKIPQNIICYPYGSKWHIADSYKNAEEFYDYGFSLELGSLKNVQNKMMIPRVPFYEKDDSASIFLKIFMSQLKSN
tara:strand:- start:391 stop:1359 length:969 start_codon:yes stop_codon:yes gene_type:complete